MDQLLSGALSCEYTKVMEVVVEPAILRKGKEEWDLRADF